MAAEPCFGISVQACIFPCLLSVSNTAGFKYLPSLLGLLLLYANATSRPATKGEVAIILEFASLCSV